MCASAACPLLSVILTPEDQVASDSKAHFRLRIQYDGMPNGELLPVVVQVANDFFQAGATSYGYFQVFETPGCAPESRVPFHGINITMRPRRDSNGRFVRDLDNSIPVDETWNGISPGDCITRDVLGFASNRGWRESIGIGHEYWLKYGMTEYITVLKPELVIWRFGTMEVS